jgi:hypothetical protein
MTSRSIDLILVYWELLPRKHEARLIYRCLDDLVLPKKIEKRAIINALKRDQIPLKANNNLHQSNCISVGETRDISVRLSRQINSLIATYDGVQIKIDAPIQRNSLDSFKLVSRRFIPINKALVANQNSSPLGVKFILTQQVKVKFIDWREITRGSFSTKVIANEISSTKIALKNFMDGYKSPPDENRLPSLLHDRKSQS